MSECRSNDGGGCIVIVMLIFVLLHTCDIDRNHAKTMQRLDVIEAALVPEPEASE
jgi:hypothetical protein